MEVVHHADGRAVFLPLRLLFVVLFYYTLLQSLAKGTTTLIRINATKFEETQIHFKSDVLGAVTVVDAKAHQPAECEMVVNEIVVVCCS